MKALLTTVVLTIIVASAHAKQVPSGRPTPQELAALPDYCQARFGGNEAVRRQYQDRLGAKQFVHIHHHCIGLNLLNRSAVTLDKSLRRHYLQSAVAQFDYVLARWPKNFVLTPEAERGKAMASGLLKTVPPSRR
jgi:hypothetical protein